MQRSHNISLKLLATRLAGYFCVLVHRYRLWGAPNVLSNLKRMLFLLGKSSVSVNLATDPIWFHLSRLPAATLLRVQVPSGTFCTKVLPDWNETATQFVRGPTLPVSPNERSLSAKQTSIILENMALKSIVVHIKRLFKAKKRRFLLSTFSKPLKVRIQTPSRQHQLLTVHYTRESIKTTLKR